MNLGEKSHDCSCADKFVSGCVFVLAKALKTLLDLFFLSCLAQIELAILRFPYDSWGTPFQQLKQVVEEPSPQLPADQFSPEFVDFTSQWYAFFWFLFLLCPTFFQPDPRLRNTPRRQLPTGLYTGEACRVAKLLQIRERCVLIPAEWASDDFPFIRLASLLLFLLFLFLQDGTVSEYAVKTCNCALFTDPYILI